MHASLTDAITCPRCGPEYGMILVADEVVERRILEGWFGCANCRERYNLRQGFGDLRFDARENPIETPVASAEDALRLAALLGVREGPGNLLVAGIGAINSSAMADLLGNVEIVGAWPGLEAEAERPGVSRFATAGNLPFRSGSMRGVALTDEATVPLIADAARVAAFGARVVVYDGAPATLESIEAAGLRVIARDAGAIVAERVSF